MMKRFRSKFPVTDNLKDWVLVRCIPEPNSGCWIWLGCLMPNGYSKSGLEQPDGSWKGILGHRAAYEAFKGLIPAGLEIDHLCRNRCCVNPEHLEAVTTQINQLRGESASGKNARKTTCSKGHLFTPENTKYVKRRTTSLTHRECRICYNATMRKWYHNRKSRDAPSLP